jgi:hypothetical protein
MSNVVISAIESEISKIIADVKAKLAEVDSWGKGEVEKLEADLAALKARAEALYEKLKAAL